MGQTCENTLELRLQNDLAPKIASFLTEGAGLDSVTEYPECLNSPNSTYAIIHWKKNDIHFMQYGFCLPPSCTEQLCSPILNNFIQSNNFTNLISNEGYEIHFIPYKSQTIEIQGIFFLSCFLLMIVFGVIGTVFNNNLKNSSFWQAFSIKDNFNKLLYQSCSEGDFQFFDGIRAFCSVLIVIYHINAFTFLIPSKNRAELLEVIKGKMFHLVLSSTYSVDSFFFMAGVLMVVNTIAEIRRKDGKVNWVLLIIRRAIRYYPVFLFIVGFDCLAHGLPPAASQVLPTYNLVKNSVGDWVKSLVFMHSFLPKDRLFYLPWTWTTASDFYYYILSCFIVSVYTKKKSSAYLIILAVILLSTIYTVTISYIHNLSPLHFDVSMNFSQMFKIYFNPFTRFAPYLIGNIVGFIYLTSKKKEVSVAYEVKDEFGDRFERKCLQMCKIKNCRVLIYVLGFGLLGFLIFGPIILEIIGEDKVNLATKAGLLGFQRPLIGLSLALIFLPMILGYNNWLQRALSFKVFGLVSKLSYTIYNIHITIFAIAYMSGNFERQWSWFTVASCIVIIYSLASIIAAFVQVLIESPILNLERKILR